VYRGATLYLNKGRGGVRLEMENETYIKRRESLEAQLERRRLLEAKLTDLKDELDNIRGMYLWRTN